MLVVAAVTILALVALPCLCWTCCATKPKPKPPPAPRGRAEKRERPRARPRHATPPARRPGAEAAPESSASQAQEGTARVVAKVTTTTDTEETDGVVVTTLFNVFWILTFGWSFCINWIIFGAGLCLTVIGIPFGMQCFKLAFLFLLPFGKRVQRRETSRCECILNLIWLIPFGVFQAIGVWIVGALWCCSIIGIPFGLQMFKFADIVLFPFGATATEARVKVKEVTVEVIETS